MSEEVRQTSRTGGMKGTKPERFSLLPKAALDAMARVFAYGATKYADHNWRKGYNWSYCYDAMTRHITAFWDGETYDPESGLPQLAHAGFHIFALLTWIAEGGEGGEFDDRHRPEPTAEITYVSVGDDCPTCGAAWTEEPVHEAFNRRGRFPLT